MHLCLSCNQPCNLSSIFCESCRLALLERRTEEKPDEEPEMVKAGGGESLVNLVSLVSGETSAVGSQTEAGRGLPVQQTENEYLWSWNKSGFHSMEQEQEEEKAPSDTLLILPTQSARPARQKMPKRVRRALLIFIIVGVLALSVDGVLLAFSLTRHHAATNTAQTHASTASSQLSTSTPVTNASATVQTNATQTTQNAALLLSASHLLFTSQGGNTPNPQTVILNAGAQNALDWQITPTAPLPNWLQLSALTGSVPLGGSAQVVISVQAGGLAPGTYTSTLQVNASDGQAHVLTNSPQTLVVTLRVLVPCKLVVSPTKLSFNANLISPVPASQQLMLTHNGDCALPIRWNISADVNWVTFTSTSGVDTGAGAIIMVSVSNPGKVVGTATAILTLQAIDIQNTPLPVAPSTVTVTLTVII